MQKFHFCNIYRALDAGTVWYREHVASAKQEFSDLLWRTIVYRLVNNVGIFTALGIGTVPMRVNWRDMIWAMREKGLKPHSQAYPLALLHPPHLPTTLDRLEFILDELAVHFDRLVYEIGRCDNLQGVSELLQEQYGIGPLLALQIYRDLILVRALPYSDDDWVEIGPGAARCLRRMYGCRNVAEMRKSLRTMRADESRWLKRVGLELPEPLTLGDLEHISCEYAKFVELSSGKGRKRYYARS